MQKNNVLQVSKSKKLVSSTTEAPKTNLKLTKAIDTFGYGQIQIFKRPLR